MASLRWFPRQGGGGVTPRGRFSHDGDWSSDSEGGRRGGVNSGWRAAFVAAPLGAVIVLNSALMTNENHAECNAPVQTAAEVVAEQVHTAKMHAQLCTELQKVRAERDALDEQRHALQTAPKSSEIIVFVVVCAPCMLAGEQTPPKWGTVGIAESKEECGRGWPMG